MKVLSNARAVQVMILDFDVHHGNGTQAIFYEDPSVLMIDMHEHGIWPRTGAVTETGDGRGEGYMINVPLPGEHADARQRSGCPCMPAAWQLSYMAAITCIMCRLASQPPTSAWHCKA